MYMFTYICVYCFDLLLCLGTWLPRIYLKNLRSLRLCKGYVKEYPHKIWPWMAQYLCLSILKFPMTCHLVLNKYKTGYWCCKSFITGSTAIVAVLERAERGSSRYMGSLNQGFGGLQSSSSAFANSAATLGYLVNLVLSNPSILILILLKSPLFTTCHD